MSILKIVDFNDHNGLNEHSLYHESPFEYYNDTLYLETKFCLSEKWFYTKKLNNKLTLCIKSDINDIKQKMKESKEAKEAKEENKEIWWNTYNTYVASFFADSYKELCGGEIVEMTDQHREIIINGNYDELDDLRESIKRVMNEKEKYFVKTTGFTPKKSTNIIPIYSHDDVIKYLFGDKNDRCMKFIKHSNILIKKWNDKISLDRELRVFINNDRINISQQDPSQEHYFLSYTLSNNHGEIYEKCSELWKSIKDKVFYTVCILDVYVDDELDVHLIEINPSHSWTGAGSALFTWKELNNEKIFGEVRVY
jgi:hypothetical protein